ncbi:MAG: potassium/proton antiporter, partial [Magnetospirillum sp.]
RERVRSVLEIESGSNDPMAIFLAIVLIRFLTEPGSHQDFGAAMGIELVREFGLGALVGGLGGVAIVQAVNRLAVERGLLPIAALSLALVVYGAAAVLGGSGFLAVYVAGLVAGNSKLSAPETLRRFQDGATWLAQIAMFLTLGLLATPSEFPAILPGALAVAMVLIVLARPVAVWLSLLPFRTRANETAFVAWVGLRGAVGILLGLLPMVAGIEDGRLYFNVAFIVVLVSLAVQGWTIRPVAGWLGQIVPPRIGPVERMELEIPGARHELVSYRIVADSLVAAEDQRLPRWAIPSLVLREGRSLLGASAGRLRPGDTVYLFARPERVLHLDRLFASPATMAEADRQFFGDFALDPMVRMEAVSFLYDVPIEAVDKDLRLDEFLRRELARAPGIGDRVPVGGVELIVRALSKNGAIAEVGLALEPTRIDEPRLPLFPTASQVWERLKRLAG